MTMGTRGGLPNFFYLATDLTLGVSLFQHFALIVLLSAPHYCDFNLQSIAFIIYREWHDSQSPLFGRRREAAYLSAAQEQFADALVIVAHVHIPLLKGGYAGIHKKRLAPADDDVRTAKRALELPERFHFMTEQTQTGLKCLEDLIIRVCFLVLDVRRHRTHIVFPDAVFDNVYLA